MRKLSFTILQCISIAVVISSYAWGQSADVPAQTADRFPYAFSNFVWWTDTELRTDLKQRIPSLGDDLARNSTLEAKVRTTLLALLKEKGIRAEIQTFEPSLDSASAKRAPDAPPPAIVFSIASPEILIEKLVLDNTPDGLTGSLKQIASQIRAKPYATTTFWLYRRQITESLQQAGYLSASVTVEPGAPNKVEDHYEVPLNAIIVSGPVYHVSTVKADAGPLVQGRDLSPYFSVKPGDIATPSAFGRLAGALRSVYWHAGYPDVEFEGAPILDTAHALASYRFQVIPGPLYRLRGLKFKNLDADQEKAIRNLLGLKTGDVYDGLSVAMLNQKMATMSNTFKGLGFSYKPLEDKQAHVVDLTLTLYKQ